MAVDREALHKVIDELPDESLSELYVRALYLKHKQTHPGSAWFRAMYDIFEPVREEVTRMGLTEEEVNQIIDEALEESRRARS